MKKLLFLHSSYRYHVSPSSIQWNTFFSPSKNLFCVTWINLYLTHTWMCSCLLLAACIAAPLPSVRSLYVLSTLCPHQALPEISWLKGCCTWAPHCITNPQGLKNHHAYMKKRKKHSPLSEAQYDKQEYHQNFLLFIGDETCLKRNICIILYCRLPVS